MNFAIDIFSKYKVKTIKKWTTRVAFDEFESDGSTRINTKDGSDLMDYISHCIKHTDNVINVIYYVTYKPDECLTILIEGFNGNTGESDNTTLVITRNKED